MMLEVSNLKKTFFQGTNELPILKGVDLSLAEGKTLAILGQSGSGKSTLLSLLAGLDRPNSGSVKVDGVDLSTLDERALAKFRSERIGIVFQQFHLMSTLTAMENVSLPLEILSVPNALELAKEALIKTGLGHRLHHFPYQLSGGECQRVAIARAFLPQPKMILADEPSGSLDTKTGREVLELLFSQVTSTNMTLVLVTHNEKLAEKCDSQMELVDGILKLLS